MESLRSSWEETHVGLPLLKGVSPVFNVGGKVGRQIVLVNDYHWLSRSVTYTHYLHLTASSFEMTPPSSVKEGGTKCVRILFLM